MKTLLTLIGITLLLCSCSDNALPLHTPYMKHKTVGEPKPEPAIKQASVSVITRQAIF